MLKGPGQFGWQRAFIGWGFGSFFFRILGYGLHASWTRELSFSERFGYSDYVRIGKLIVRGLKPF